MIMPSTEKTSWKRQYPTKIVNTQHNTSPTSKTPRNSLKNSKKKTIINLVFNYITHPITRLIKEHHRHLNGLWDHWRHRLGRVWRISTQWRSSSCLEVSLLVEVSWGWFSNIPCMNPWRWMIVFNWWRRFRMSYYMSLKSFVLAIWIWIW